MSQDLASVVSQSSPEVENDWQGLNKKVILQRLQLQPFKTCSLSRFQETGLKRQVSSVIFPSPFPHPEILTVLNDETKCNDWVVHVVVSWGWCGYRNWTILIFFINLAWQRQFRVGCRIRQPTLRTGCLILAQGLSLNLKYIKVFLK